MSKQVTLVRGDDWEGLYVNGNLFAEGHSISAERALELLGHKVTFVSADCQWLENAGSLPEALEEVQIAHE